MYTGKTDFSALAGFTSLEKDDNNVIHLKNIKTLPYCNNE